MVSNPARADHLAPAAAERPHLADKIPPFIVMEREVEDQFRPQMLKAMQSKIDALGDSVHQLVPACPTCGQPMPSRESRSVSWLTRFGRVRAAGVVRFRCRRCKTQCRPLIEYLGVEPGRISGSLARLLALLGVVVPYELAAELAGLFFSIKVSPMGVWHVVQRLGEAAEQYTDALSSYHSDSHSEDKSTPHAADVVVLGVDGCSLGMQVRSQRRHRETPKEKLPPLRPLEEGHFREVKTGLLLLPSERFEPSPGRHSLVRRLLVTCLGDADCIFDRLWAKLQQLGWLGGKTVVVIVGDGAEWIWNRASMFINRCEILDFWHAIEYAWNFARLQYGDGSKQARRWIDRLAQDLRAGKVNKVLARLRRLQPHTPEAQSKLEDLIRYYTNNARRMRYDEYLRLGYGIGSGAVESAHKQIVHARMRQAGMRWSEAGARRILALRLLLLNKDWELTDYMRMVALPA